MVNRKEKFIIFLDGVKTNDFTDMENRFEQQLLDFGSDSDSIIVYDKIPSIFTGLSTWIKSTNLCCWFCDFTFNNVPIFIPTYVNKTDANIEIGTFGNFCSFCCAFAYIQQNNMFQYVDYLSYLYQIMNSQKIKAFIPTPPKTRLIKYGGNMTDKEYIDLIHTLINIQKTTPHKDTIMLTDET